MAYSQLQTPRLCDRELNSLCPQWQTQKLSACLAYSQLQTDSFFLIFKFSGLSFPGMTSSTLQPHFLSKVYYDNCNCHIQCYATELRAE